MSSLVDSGLPQLAHRPQRLGVILAWALQHLAGRRLLDLLAVAQHHDAMGHLGHHGEVVGDVDCRRVELLDDVAHRRQHFDLGGDVERGGRLVEDDEIGPAGHGHGRHGALQLAARDLVGIAVADRVGIGQLQALVEIARVGLRLGAAHDAVAHGGFDRLVDEPVGGIEARRRHSAPHRRCATPAAPAASSSMPRSDRCRRTRWCRRLMRQPGRAKPMAASPRVDLPAPDSPIRPRTSPRFRVRSTPLTIGCQTSSLKPSILRPLISRRTSPLTRFFSVFIAQSACLVQEPVDHEIHARPSEAQWQAAGIQRLRRGRR